MEFSKHGQGTTSVKVHQPSGGASQIQIGGGYGEDKSDKVGAKTSVKVAHPSGGASQIQIGGGYGEDKADKGVTGKPGQGSYGKASVQSSGIQIGGGYGDDRPDPKISAKPGQSIVPTATKPVEEEKKEEAPIAGAAAAGTKPASVPVGGAVKTSVQVKQPPGGKSTALW